MHKTNLAQSTTESHFRDREYPRCDLELRTQLELEDGRAVDFNMRNISQSGFGGYSTDKTPIGSKVELVLPNIGPLPARVVWQIGTAIGARLSSELSVPQIISLALQNLHGDEQASEENPKE
jgi:hypothetical protein